uniref:Uncharacterized protein n=1 Tax=Anguilla anguilla TaxID=7936 RepID=A0A0E9WMK7_ANGAN
MTGPKRRCNLNPKQRIHFVSIMEGFWQMCKVYRMLMYFTDMVT